MLVQYSDSVFDTNRQVQDRIYIICLIFLNHKLSMFMTVTYCVKKYLMELEKNEDSDQSAHLCSLTRVLQLQSKNPKNQKHD